MANNQQSTSISGPGDVRYQLTFRSGTGSTTPTSNAQNGTTAAGANTAYGINDYTWAQGFSDGRAFGSLSDLGLAVPKLICTEFQPTRTFGWNTLLGETINSLLGFLGGIGPNAGGGGWGAKAAGVLVDKTIFSPQTFLDSFAQGGSNNALGKDSMVFIKQLFTGIYLKAYELPFFGKTFINADTSDSWSVGGSDVAIGSTASKFLEERYSINFPMVPVWNHGKDNYLNFDFDFYLINSSQDNLVKNFKFLTSLASGNFWAQLGMVQQSPNVWDIQVPGRFHIYFGAMGVKIEYAGKTRLCAGAVSQINGTSNAYNLPPDMLFPDAYHVEITVKSFTPNNFNCFLEYFVNGDKVTVGGSNKRRTIGNVKSGQEVKALDPNDAADQVFNATAGKTVNDIRNSLTGGQ